jgi:hypothetical protein
MGGEIQEKCLSYNNKDEIFCNFKNIVELLFDKYVCAEV